MHRLLAGSCQRRTGELGAAASRQQGLPCMAPGKMSCSCRNVPGPFSKMLATLLHLVGPCLQEPEAGSLPILLFWDLQPCGGKPSWHCVLCQLPQLQLCTCTGSPKRVRRNSRQRGAAAWRCGAWLRHPQHLRCLLWRWNSRCQVWLPKLLPINLAAELLKDLPLKVLKLFLDRVTCAVDEAQPLGKAALTAAQEARIVLQHLTLQLGQLLDQSRLVQPFHLLQVPRRVCKALLRLAELLSQTSTKVWLALLQGRGGDFGQLAFQAGAQAHQGTQHFALLGCTLQFLIGRIGGLPRRGAASGCSGA